MTWWKRRARERRSRAVYASYYLVPLVLLTRYAGIDAFNALDTVLLLLGIVTLGVSRALRMNTWTDVVVGVLGHALPRVAFARRDVTSIRWSSGVLAVVLGIYWHRDVWPYPITPIEFVGLACIGLCITQGGEGP